MGHDHDHHHPHEDEGPRVELTPEQTSALNRRDFLRVSTTIAAATTLTTAACQAPVEKIVPFNEGPDGLRTGGKKLFYASVHEGVPLLARNREGRPIFIAPNKKHPTRAVLSVRTQAALLDLYDPDRAQLPMSVRRSKGVAIESSWNVVTQTAAQALREHKGKIAVLTRPMTGVATRAVFDEFARTVGARVVEYAPLQADATVAAWQKAFGQTPMPEPRLDRAKLIVGFGPEHLDVPQGAMEADQASRRDPESKVGMSRSIVFEGRMSLTGSNADRRFRVRESQLAAVAFAVARELIVELGFGPLAQDGAVRAALDGFKKDTVAQAAGVKAEVIAGVAKELQAAGAEAIALAGETALSSPTGVLLGVAVNLLNAALGAFGTTLDLEAFSTPAHNGLAALEALVKDMASGEVKMLILAGPNPVYDAPTSLGFAAAADKLAYFVSLNDRIDETSALADHLAPASHSFEAWADHAFPGNVHTLQQPLVRPLYATHGLLDILIAWAREATAPAAAAVGTKTATVAGTKTATVAGGGAAALAFAGLPAGATQLGYLAVRTEWGKMLGIDPTSRAFDKAWEEVLRDGFWQGPKSAIPAPTFDVGALANVADAMKTPDALEVVFHPHYAIYDGRAANNGWLQELPDPITRSTWGGWVGIAPKVFDAQGLKNGDVMVLEVNGAKLELPAYRHAGLHENVVSVPLGFGRRAGGPVGEGVGVNAFPALGLDGSRRLRSGLSAKLSRGTGNDPLAIPQGCDVLDRKQRPLFPMASLDEYKKNPKAGTEQPEGEGSAYPEHEYKAQRWGMTIDLSKCDGCNKCAVACQSENNIPVVGKLGVIQGREMSWIRVDRYWDAGEDKAWGDEVWNGPLAVVEEPRALFEPMLCQHCDNAPCESVCPFSATMHSEDGLNQQIYNRCVGTRFCSNNCPFKVRRFNWHEYSAAKANLLLRIFAPQVEEHSKLNVRGRMPMKNNPEVTVRSRGVMEKCTFCVQRIREARAEATREGHSGKIADGAVETACMEACPTNAIVFGDLNDPESRVSKLASDPRAMRLLEATNVRPAVRYLTKVTNDNG